MRTADLDKLWRTLQPVGAREAQIERDNTSFTDSASQTLQSDTGGLSDVNSSLAIELRPEPRWYAFGKRNLRLSGALMTFDATAAVWLSVGFISGMIAWHSVGFWNFVTETVLQSPGDHPRVVALSAKDAPSARDPSSRSALTLTTGSLPQRSATNRDGCVSLTVDRSTSKTWAAPCARDRGSLREAGKGQRGDRLAMMSADQTAPSAAKAIEAGRDKTAATVAYSTDFDLTLSAD